MSEDGQTPSTLFLERQTYRRRRIIDGVKLVPVLGLVVFFLPVLWAGDGRTSGGLIYLFTAWGFLIILMAVLSRLVSRLLGDEQPGRQGGDREGL